MGNFDSCIQNIINGLNAYMESRHTKKYFIGVQSTIPTSVPAFKRFSIELFLVNPSTNEKVQVLVLSKTERCTNDQELILAMGKIQSEFTKLILDLISLDTYKKFL